MIKKAAITTTSFGQYDSGATILLQKSGFEIVKNELGRTMTKREILALCHGCAGIIAGTEPYDFDTLKGLEGLKVISRVGIGMDAIDMKAAAGLGIKVVNTPSGPVSAVAELTVCLMLDLLRKVSFMDREIRAGKWKKNMGNLLRGKKTGIIGYGNIGQKVGELLIAFGCDIAYHDPAINRRNGKIGPMRLDELLEWADIVTIHVSGKSEIIGEKEFERMKRGAWLINVSRGGTVNEDKLYSSLKSGRISGAALDVFSEEPYGGALKGLNNVILTPHIGSYAAESRIEMETDAAKNLIKILSEVER